MAWFSGKVSLGSFPDLAGAVNKLSESVKNIERNFDSALGFEEKYESSGEGLSGVDNNTISVPLSALKREGGPLMPSELLTAQTETFIAEREVGKIDKLDNPNENIQCDEVSSEAVKSDNEHSIANADFGVVDIANDDIVPNTLLHEPIIPNLNMVITSEHQLASENQSSVLGVENDVTVTDDANLKNEINDSDDLHFTGNELDMGSKDEHEKENCNNDIDNIRVLSSPWNSSVSEHSSQQDWDSNEFIGLTQNESVALEKGVIEKACNSGLVSVEHELSSDKGLFHSSYQAEMDKMKKDVKMMEATLQGAAKQAQAKADEIAKLMNENEQIKATNDELKRKLNEVEVDSLREEYHQKVASFERKVYTLTKERDTLRREQSKKSDAAALLKEKDEIINQVMAEGEELSKKQAAQESQIRKLRAQIKEFEEEKKGLIAKLKIEENKAEILNKEKTTADKLLHEAIEKHQSDIIAQRECLENSLTAAKEAEAMAEARSNSEARAELEGHLRGSHEREATLLQELEELRQTLSRKEQQAMFREEMLQRDIADIQKRYQDSERRCEELITQVPESTRPLLRQIESIQETASRRADSWAAVERSLGSRLQEAESKVTTAEERERSVNDRLSQTQSRINVLEAQILCLRTEQSQLTRSLDKERQRAVENRQDYLTAKEEAEFHKDRTGQLEEKMLELLQKHKEEMGAVISHVKLLRQEVEREKNSRMDLERKTKLQYFHSPVPNRRSSTQNGILTRGTSNSTILEDSFSLQTSLASTDDFNDQRSIEDVGITPLYLKTMTPTAFEAALRHKEGELALYTSRLVSLQSICDSLSEELVKMTSESEMLQSECSKIAGMQAELDTLRKRHSSALELMGERDEELEELRADIVDMKEMYREQVDLLVGKIQTLSLH